MTDDCLTCRANRGELETPGGVLFQDQLWRLEHACEPIPMVGWLVLKPLRHVEAFADLTEEEAASFGPLTRRITRAMANSLGAVKTYIGLFAEGENSRHVHFHIIPRFSDTHPYHRGPTSFELLRVALVTGQNLGDLAAAERAAIAIRDELSSGQ